MYPNILPRRLIIFVRKPVSTLKCSEPDCYATIKNISINSNNLAGRLSSMSPEQLFRCSVQSGLANMSWDEFNGTVVSAGCGLPDTKAQIRNPYTGVGAFTVGNYTNSGVQYSPTTGTILVLNFAECIQLTEEYYAPGSLGSFNLQMTLRVQNNHYDTWDETTGHELVIITLNSGVCVNERGTSSTFLSLLTKQDVWILFNNNPIPILKSDAWLEVYFSIA